MNILTSPRLQLSGVALWRPDRGQNRYSDFVALETLLRFENCSSSHCLLFSWRRSDAIGAAVVSTISSRREFIFSSRVQRVNGAWS